MPHTYNEVRNLLRVITDFDVLDAHEIKEIIVTRLEKNIFGDLESGVFPDKLVRFVNFAKCRLNCQLPFPCCCTLKILNLHFSM